MNPHPLLRAFLAGTFVPTLALPLLLTTFIGMRLVMQAPVPIEHILIFIFPAGVVPPLWGLWSMVYFGTLERAHISFGMHGAILTFLLIPFGATLAAYAGIFQFGPDGLVGFEVLRVSGVVIACGVLVALAAYYLVWKYAVGFVNYVLQTARYGDSEQSITINEALVGIGSPRRARRRKR